MRLLILSQRLVLLLGGTVGDGVVVIVVDSSSPSSSCCSFLSNNDSDLDLLSRNDAERADAASSVPDIVCERDSIMTVLIWWTSPSCLYYALFSW